MQFLQQVICNPERGTEILQRGLSGRSQTSQNGTEEQPLQNRPANHGDTASGVSHLFQSSHAHGLFPTVCLQTRSPRQAESLTYQQPHGIHPQGGHRADAGRQPLPPHPARQHFRTEKVHSIVSTSQKRKKGKGNRRSDGLLFGRGGNVALQGQAVVAIHHRQAQPHTYLPHRREELLQQKTH